MTREKKLVVFFATVSLISFIAALIPVLKGERLNVTFLGGGVVFLAVAVANAKKIPPSGGSPPAA